MESMNCRLHRRKIFVDVPYLGKTFWRKRESGKHRYVKFICGKIENKKLAKSLKHKVLPYIKTTIFKEVVTEHSVDTSTSFF
jgi:hypothetical protein